MVRKEGTGPLEIKISRLIPGKRWKLLRLITRVKDFPTFMPNVKQSYVLEKSKDGAMTYWSIEVDGIPMSWKEKDTFDFSHFTIHFEAVEGDLEHFKGRWILRDAEEDKTQIDIEISVRIGIPLIEDVIGHKVAEKIEKNFNLMLDAIEKKVNLQRYKHVLDRKMSGIRGFAVIGHPYNLQHLIRYFKFFKSDLKLPSPQFLTKIFEITPSYKSYDIRGFRSQTGKETHGYFIMCPIIPDMLSVSPEQVFEKVIEACKIAEGLGVGIAALGGFTSIAGEKFNRELASAVNVPLTTGNTFTVAMILEGITRAAELMEISLPEANVTVIGGVGDIGSACARVLSEKVKKVTITGRNEKSLMEMERILSYYGKAEIRTSLQNHEAVRDADLVIAAASASSSFVDIHLFRPGAVVCDVGYPKNISYLQTDRKDILIYSGGIVDIPSEFNLGFDIGMPSSKVLYGCFAESILLDLEERYENFSWGKGNITKEKIDYIRRIGEKHGFRLAPFFWGNKLLHEEDIRRIRENAKRMAVARK